MPDEQPVIEGQLTDGAAAFLSFLCANPRGDDVALAVVHGPLRPLAATASAIYQAPAPEELALIGAFGMPDVTWQKYSSISVAAPLTTCRTFRENRLIMRSGATSGGWFTDDERRILQDAILTPAGEAPFIITVPLAVKGLPIGVLCVHTPPREGLTTVEERQVRGTASALALWLYMHQVSESSRARHPLPEPSPHVRITDRQVRVLELVAQGRSAREIGEALQYSESTVKKDLMRLMSFLNVRDREAAITRAREIGLLP